MRGTNQLLLAGAAAILVTLAAGQVMAQNQPNQGGGGGGRRQGNNAGGAGRQRGNFDPAQRVERYRETLEVTDDAEWNVMKPLVQNVLDARMAAMAGGRGGGFGRGGRGGRGGGNTPADQPQRPNPFANNPAMVNLDAEALQKAIAAKVPSSEIKPLLARYFERRKLKQAELDQARDALRAVLTPRQEAIAALDGLL